MFVDIDDCFDLNSVQCIWFMLSFSFINIQIQDTMWTFCSEQTEFINCAHLTDSCRPIVIVKKIACDVIKY